MTLKITEVLGSISFRNKNVAITDPTLIANFDELPFDQTDNKTYYMTDTLVGDWCCTGYIASTGTMLNEVNKANDDQVLDDKFEKLGRFWTDCAAVAIVDTDHFWINEEDDNEANRVLLENWTGTINLLCVVDDKTNRPLLVIEGIGKKVRNKTNASFTTFDNEWQFDFP